MSFTAEEYRTFNTRLTRFMNIYAKFIAQDLYSSIQLKIEYDQTNNEYLLKDGGKKIDVLIYLYDLFITIMKLDRDEEKIERLFIVFDEIIDKYLKHFQDNREEGTKIYNSLFPNQYLIQYEPIKNLLDNKYILQMFIMFNDTIQETSKKIALNSYIQDYLIKSQRAKIQNDKFYIVQSLYEFHNAISHLFIALKSSSDDRNNIDKAASHLHRGTLDYLKNYIQLSELKDFQKNELVELRIKEFDSIGIKAIDNMKKEILVNYMFLLKDD